MIELLNLEQPSCAIIFALILPLAGALSAALIQKQNLREVITIIISTALFINILMNILPLASNGLLPQLHIIETIPGLSIIFKVEPIGIIFALVASFLWIVTSIYSIGYMRGNKEARHNKFYMFFALAIFGAIGIAFAGNIFTLFLFYEFLTLCTFPLVTHSQTAEAKKSGRVYLGILIGTSICFFLPAIIWTYNIAGTLDFTPGGILKNKASSYITGILLLLYVYGIGKAALMPIHRWLPAAMVAPTPVSALLHAVAVVKAGVFSIIKIIIYIFGVDNLNDMIAQNWWSGGWLVYIAGFTILSASIIAIRQDNLKKRLAFSTISQLSYVIMAISILTPPAILAASFHIVAHAVGKITLFFAAGSIYTASKKKNISQLNGIGKQMPWTMTAFSIAAISMIGLPPTVGFLSKFYIIQGAIEGYNYFVIFVLTASTLLNAAYFLPIIYAAFFKDKPMSENKITNTQYKEAPITIIIALTITATLTVGLFFFPNLFLWLSEIPIMFG